MKRLKTILKSNYLYIVLGLFLVGYILISTKIIKYNSKYNDGNAKIQGEIIKCSIKDNKLSFVLKTKERINVTYYLKDGEVLNDFKIGSIVLVKGEIKTPSDNTIPNTFNYRKYLYSNKIYKIMNAKSIEILNNNLNIFEKIKTFIYKKVEVNKYLKLFIIGDKSSLDNDIYDNFKDVGVAHLLAVSGMHVSFFVVILEFLLKRFNINKRKILISVFLFFYAYIVNYSASILRVVVFFFLNYLNKKFDLNLDNKKVLFWTAFFMLVINPFFIYQTGFIYSFVTVLSLFITQKYLKQKYLIDILIISFWALLFTLPITISLNFEINLLTFLGNLLLIPFVTFVLYPFALICFLIPFFLPVFIFLTKIMEIIITIIGSVDFLTISIPKLNWLVIVCYYSLLLLYVHYNLKRYLFLIIVLIFFVKISFRLDKSYYVSFMDVGQGDCTLLITPHQNDVIIIDTGGIMNYGSNKSYNVTDNVILYLKSLGITKIRSIIITHGDYDHMGEAIYLVNNFKIEKVIFNCGEVNELEQELIKVLDKKKIPYYFCIKELNIDDNKLYFLNNKDYANENDNSSVIYTKLNNHKFLFMGDAGVKVEGDLIQKYNLQDIDVLKVGHHGSKTSSSEGFINEINPRYSIISVGKNNRYGHPNSNVLDNLEYSKIYRTDKDGSIVFKIKSDKLKIKTCAP